MANRRQKRLTFFGDSICFGQGVSIHLGWVPRTAERVSNLSSELDPDIVTVNSSINGNTTRLALERMPYDVQSSGVDICLIQFGMNDCNHWQTDRGLPRVSQKAFGANLEEILQRASVFGAQKLLLNTNHPTSRNSPMTPFSPVTYQESNARYNQTIREVAQKWAGKVTLNDIERVFEKHIQKPGNSLAQLLLEDGLHLSKAGHDLYFDCIAPVVESAILSLGTTPGRPEVDETADRQLE